MGGTFDVASSSTSILGGGGDEPLHPSYEPPCPEEGEIDPISWDDFPRLAKVASWADSHCGSTWSPSSGVSMVME